MKKAILIVFDSVRQDHISCYGYGRETTPNLDTLATNGSRFDATVPKKILPITRSSAYGILTGQTQQVLTVNECPQKLTLLQQVARPSLIGSNHLLLFSGLKWNIGFSNHYLMEAHPPFFRPCRDIIDWFLWAFDETVANPTFSLLWFNETHLEYRPDFTLEKFIADDMPTVDSDIVFYGFSNLNPDYKVDPRRHMAQYDASIHNLDDAIAPILALADDETLIIVCSDHGDFLGEFGHFFTHEWQNRDGIFTENEYQQALDILRNVFLVMSQPSPCNNGKATILDIAPTIAEWLGLPKLPFWEGDSLL